MKKILAVLFSCIIFAGCAGQSSSSYKTAVEMMKNKQYDQAIELFNKALTEEKDAETKSNITYNIGFCFGLKGDYEKEIEYFKKALDIFDACQPALYDLGVYYRENGDLESALKMFEKLVEVNDIHEAGFYMLGLVYSDLGNDEEAYKNIQTAAELGSPEAQKLLE